jgi:hypothetical protein
MKATRGGEPPRWRADPARRPHGAALLLRGARRPQPPGNGELERLGARVAEIPRLSAARARRGARLAAAAAAGVTLVALGTGVWAWRGKQRVVSAPTPTLWAAAPATAQPPIRTAVIAPAPAPEAAVVEAPPAARPTAARVQAPHHARPARAQAVEPAAAPASNADTLAREIALVDAARANLGSAPARALTALDAHRREFPRGQLAAEREFLAVEALRRLDRIAEARARAAELEARYPSSSYAARAARLLRAP